jgi:hypothetical protein
VSPAHLLFFRLYFWPAPWKNLGELLDLPGKSGIAAQPWQHCTIMSRKTGAGKGLHDR